MKPMRLERIPETMREQLRAARQRRQWSQRELGHRIGLTQAHISAIETGKTVPRYDTLLDLVRALGFDLVMVPRALAPAVQALIRDYRNAAAHTADDETQRPLYADDQAGDEVSDEL